MGSASWSELFSKHDFFHKYRYYLQITASTGDADLQLKWCDSSRHSTLQQYKIYACRSGTVESRLRQLVMKLEFLVEALTLAHPFVKGFHQTLHCIDEAEVRAVAQGDISEAVKKRKKEEIEGKEGASTVYSTTFYIGLAIEPKPGALVLSSCGVCSATHPGVIRRTQRVLLDHENLTSHTRRLNSLRW